MLGKDYHCLNECLSAATPYLFKEFNGLRELKVKFNLYLSKITNALCIIENIDKVRFMSSKLLNKNSTIFNYVIAQHSLNNCTERSDLPTIFYAIDNTYAPYAAVSLQSLLDNTKSKNFNVIIFSFGIENNYREVFLRLAEQSEVSMLAVVLNKKLVDGFHESKHISNAAYLCALLPDLIQSKIALFIDADTIFLGDVFDLLEIGEKVEILAACEENKDKSHHARLDLKIESPYVNTGLLLCNTDAWRHQAIYEQVKNTNKERGLTEYHDQDLINIIFENKLELLNEKWNKRRVGTTKPYTHEDFHSKQGMIHFNGSIKPWMAWAKAEDREFYRSYAEHVLTNSRWFIEEPRNINEMKNLALQLENEGKLNKANLILKKIIYAYEQAFQQQRN